MAYFLKVLELDGELILDGPIRGEKSLSSNIGRVTSEEQVIEALKLNVERVAKVAVEVRQKDIYLSMNEFPVCSHDNQRRCIIFICSEKNRCDQCGFGKKPKSCQIVWKQCFNCNWAFDLNNQTSKCSHVVPIIFQERIYQHDLMGSVKTEGMPLTCSNCKSSAFAITHCSKKDHCKRNGCSRKNHCQKYSGWKCLACSNTGSFS